MATDPKAIAVAMAIKQSIEMSGSPGLSVNAHPNAFFLNVIGAIDLLKAAEAAIMRAESFVAAEKERFEKAVDAVYLKLLAEARSGAVSVQDALARIKTKAGGELLAVEGAVEEAVSRVQNVWVPADPDGRG